MLVINILIQKKYFSGQYIYNPLLLADEMEKHPIVKHILYKWQAGHSPFIAICGETNSGKTFTALGLADELMKGHFNPAGHVFVDLKQFILRFYKSKHEVFIIDEAKIHLDSSRWWADFNKLFGDIVATQRHRNNIYIVIMPLLKKLAREHRDMIDVILEMKTPGYAMTYKVNRRWSELEHFELWKFFAGGMVIPLPRKELIEEYRQIESVSKDEIMKDIMKKILKTKRCGCGKRNPDFNGCEDCGDRLAV